MRDQSFTRGPDGLGKPMSPSLASLVLVHGAANGPSVFDGWPGLFTRLDVSVVDLQEGLDVAHASMADYADAVVSSAGRLPAPVALCGWSMGGLVAMLAAVRARPAFLVLLEPSPPGEVQGFHPEVQVRTGTFDGADAYGPFPPGITARPESLLARAERKQGITVTSLPCPTLVVYGDDFPEERGRAIARLYRSEELYFPKRSHWDLVLDLEVARAIARHLEAFAYRHS